MSYRGMECNPGDVQSFKEEGYVPEGAEWTDEQLADVIGYSKRWIDGIRWSWKVVARNVIVDGYAHASFIGRGPGYTPR